MPKSLSKVNYLEYLFGESIILFEDKMYSICNWESSMNWKLFKNGTRITDSKIEKKLKIKVRSLIIRNTSDKKKTINPLSIKKLYFYGKRQNGTFEVALLCDPFKGKKNISFLVDSLNNIMNRTINNNKIDGIYFPLKLTKNTFSNKLNNKD
jgi:hypothetical protein